MVLLFCPFIPSLAADFYVSPSGSSSSDGSLASPWDLQTAFSHPSAVDPGDTIWIRGGTYRGVFTSKLLGTSTKPIIVRNYDQERVILDGNVSGLTTSTSVINQIVGGYVWYWGFEITNTNPQRVFDDSYLSAPPGRAAALLVLVPGVKFINLLIYDTSEGLNAWVLTTDFEAYGNVVFNIGWMGNTQGPRGHGLYSQNRTGATPKLFESNIFFNEFLYSAQLYGKQPDILDNFIFRKNIFFNPHTILFGGSSSTPLTHIIFDENLLYNTPLQIGYMSAYNNGITLTNNYFAFENTHQSVFTRSRNVTFSRNTFIAIDNPTYNDFSTLMYISLNALPVNTPSDYHFDSNTYYKPYHNPGTAFALANAQSQDVCDTLWFNRNSQGYKSTCSHGIGTSVSWQDDLGYDLNGTYHSSLPTGPQIFFTKNKYDPARANIAIYNWDHTDIVDIPGPTVQQVLSPGDRYKLHSVLDYLNDVVFGTYEGGDFSVSMVNHTVAKPIGWNATLGPSTFPEFGSFVLIKMSGSSPLLDSPNEMGFLPFKNMFDPTKETLNINYTATVGAEATLTVYDRKGNKVKDLHVDTSGESTWDGRNNQGSVVGSGVYMLLLKSGGATLSKKIVVVK